MECGQVVVRRVDAEDYDDDGAEVDGEYAVIEVGLPELVKPGFSEFVMFEKQASADASGVEGSELMELVRHKEIRSLCEAE